MRLHRLELQAFGPFAGRQSVDFDTLSDQGLFLLNGPTGAGKSSVLDAVCFALYGSVPGARQSAKRLRSDHAEPAVAPEVSLEFSAADRRFQVVRSPAWERPVRRGSGTTTEQARTLLSERVGAEWVQRSARNDEAGLELQSVLGMDKEQFTKVVMLPQGEFAAFLRADATSRRDLLQRLFSTTRFEALERLFAEHSQLLAREVAEQDGVLDQLFQRAVDEAGRHGLTPATGPDLDQDRAAAMHALLEAVSELRSRTAEERSSLMAQVSRADEALATLRDRRTRHGLLVSLRHQRREHEDRAEEIRELADVARRHDRARSLAAALRQDDEKASIADGVLAEYTEALERVHGNPIAVEYLDMTDAGVQDAGAQPVEQGPEEQDAGAQPEPGAEEQDAGAQPEPGAEEQDAGAEPVEQGPGEQHAGAEPGPGVQPEPGAAPGPGVGKQDARADQLGTASGTVPATGDDRPVLPASVLDRACAVSASGLAVLRAALPDEQRLLALRSELHALTTELSELDGALGAGTEALTLIERRRAADLERLAPLRRAADGLTHLRAELAAATAAERAVHDHAAAWTRRVAADERFRGASEHFLALKQQWLATLQLRLEQAADELAEHLVDGEPCPVCGSHDHPAPVAPPGGDRVSLDQEQTARRLQDDAESEMDAARRTRDSAVLAVAELHARIGGLSPEEASEATRSAAERLRAAETAETECAAVEDSIEKLTRDAERCTAERDDLRERRATAGSRRSSLLDQDTELSLRLSGLLAGAPSLATRIEDVQAATADLGRLRATRETLLRARGDRAESWERLQEGLRDSRFDSVEEARAALLEEGHRERIERTVKEHEIRGHRLDAAWDDDAVRHSLVEEQDGLVPPTEDDERTAAHGVEEVRGRAQRAGIDAEVLGHSVTQVEAYLHRFDTLHRSVEPLREQARMVAAVAETARGGGENLYRMPLATYVLASRLEQVAAAATERLLEMSDGRYQLVHSDARAGNRRSGLGLNVIDGWTGNSRDTATLSGGESFMASLALALGLADVVQQEAGGLDIETLFIDEGFGSLDEQALEQVMDALEGLRSGGRVVGLVSHVPELKQRVGAQLQVVKGRQGSVLRLAGLPASG